ERHEEERPQHAERSGAGEDRARERDGEEKAEGEALRGEKLRRELLGDEPRRIRDVPDRAERAERLRVQRRRACREHEDGGEGAPPWIATEHGVAEEERDDAEAERVAAMQVRPQRRERDEPPHRASPAAGAVAQEQMEEER